MRVSLTAGLLVAFLIGATWIAAQPRTTTRGQPKDGEDGQPAKEQPVVQPKKTPEKPGPSLTSRMVLSRLQTEIDATPFHQPAKFKEFLTLLGEMRDVDFDVNLDAFAEAFGADVPNPLEQEVVFSSPRKRATALEILNHSVRQLSKPGNPTMFVIRGGRVDIIPGTHGSKEHMLNQTFRADVKDQRLDAALEELTDLTGVSIVLDPRARQKAQTTVTARFNGDVALQDAVRMLSDMAELKIVYLVTGIYVTTPEHAVVMEKDLRKAYGIPETPPLDPAAMPGLAPPMMPGPFLPEASPLMPPLPPALRKRLEAAA